MRTGSRSPTRPPFIEAPLPRSGATAAPVAVSNETVLHRGVEPYCNDFTHKRRGLQRDRPSSRPGQGPLQVVLGRVAVSNETALHRGTTSRWDVAKWFTGRGLQRDRPSSRHVDAGAVRLPVEVAVSNETALHRGRGPSAIPAQLVPVAVSNETALHRGLFVPGTEPVPGYKSRSPTRPPFIEATSPATCATWRPVAVSNETALHRGPMIVAGVTVRMLVAVSNETALHRGLVKRGKRAKSRGRGLQRDRPSSRPGRGHRHPRRRRVAVSNETALHRGMPVPATGLPGGQVAVSNETALHRGSADTWLSEYLVPVAVSNETALHRGPVETLLPDEVAQSRSPTRPPFIEADQRLLYPGQPASRGLQRDRPSSRLAARPGPPALGEVAVSDETALHRGLYRPGGRHRGGLVAVSDETALHRGRFLPSGW